MPILWYIHTFVNKAKNQLKINKDKRASIPHRIRSKNREKLTTDIKDLDKDSREKERKTGKQKTERNITEKKNNERKGPLRMVTVTGSG